MVTKNFTSEVFGIQRLFYDRRRPVSEIAKLYGLDSVTTWALVLEGRDDQERLEILEREVEGLSCKPPFLSASSMKSTK